MTNPNTNIPRILLLFLLSFFLLGNGAKASYIDDTTQSTSPSLSQNEELWQAPTYPLHEIRAVWLATIGGIDWPHTKATDSWSIQRQKQELCNILDKLQRANINMVVMQTRVRGTVIYPSSIEPWDDCLTGKFGQHPGYDPLQFAIEECHRRGMEFHAWLVSIPLGELKKQKSYGSLSIMRKHPELCKTVGAEVFMQPNASGTADYIAGLCKEIIQKYDVDGISLDYIRYPESIYKFKDNASASQKRENITRIIRRVHDVVKSIKPWVKLSSSPIGKYRDLKRYSSIGWNCYDAVYQDPQAWLRDNIQDMLFPMMYFRDNHFYPFLFDWLEHAHGHPVAPGLAIYLLDPREGRWALNDVRAEMHTARNSNIGGMVFYRAKFLNDNHKGIYNTTCQEFFPYPALPPRMTWSSDTIAPLPPNGLRCENGVLTWNEGEYNSDRDAYTYYNIYGSNVYPVDVTKAENLLQTRVRDTHYELTGRSTSRRYFAVCASDRFGNQSAAAQEQNVMTSLPPSTDAWNPCSRLGDNGKRVDDRMQLLKSASGKKSKKRKR
ncbi:MAG: family 10 glycosylhydrolase [Bacteroidaceae bacterium]|nr:family 10 glycosylhydrolase [Bacteroidaceae bacterium]